MTDRMQTPMDEIQVVTVPDLGMRHKVLGSQMVEARESSVGYVLHSLIDEMQYQAFQAGADAVVSFVYSVTYESVGGSHRYSGSAMGTAVLLPWPAGHADPLLGADNTSAE